MKPKIAPAIQHKMTPGGRNIYYIDVSGMSISKLEKLLNSAKNMMWMPPYTPPVEEENHGMQIGGTDLIFDTHLSDDEFFVAMQKSISMKWPYACYEEDHEQTMLNWFCYKGPYYAEKWDALGAVEETYGTMIYALKKPGAKQATVVFDREDKDSWDIVEYIVNTTAISRPQYVNGKFYP